MCWSSRRTPVQVIAWYSCNFSSAASFLLASLLSNKMWTVMKLGLCIRKCLWFILLASSQEVGGRGGGRGSQWRKQADGLPMALPAGWTVGIFSPASPVPLRGTCGKKALGADLGTQNGKHALVYQTRVQNCSRS